MSDHDDGIFRIPARRCKRCGGLLTSAQAAHKSSPLSVFGYPSSVAPPANVSLILWWDSPPTRTGPPYYSGLRRRRPAPAGPMRHRGLLQRHRIGVVADRTAISRVCRKRYRCGPPPGRTRSEGTAPLAFDRRWSRRSRRMRLGCGRLQIPAKPAWIFP